MNTPPPAPEWFEVVTLFTLTLALWGMAWVALSKWTARNAVVLGVPALSLGCLFFCGTYGEMMWPGLRAVCLVVPTIFGLLGLFLTLRAKAIPRWIRVYGIVQSASPLLLTAVFAKVCLFGHTSHL